MSINYEYYKIFYNVAKYGSFSKAAMVLDRGQPNITKMISNLEGQIGSKLFIRSHRGVQLTSEGKKLYEHVEIAMEHLLTVEEELMVERSLNKGTVRIATTEVALYGCVLPALTRFSSDYPNVKIKLTNQSNIEALHSLSNKIVDFAIVSTSKIDERIMKYKVIKDFRDILCCKKGYNEQIAMKGIHAIEEAPYISLDSNTYTYAFLNEYLFKNDIYKKPDISVATVGQILPIIKSGAGIGFIAEFIAKEALENGDISEIVLDNPPPIRSVCLAINKNQSSTPAARKFMEYL